MKKFNRREFVAAVGALVIGVPGIAIAAKEKFYAGIVRDSNDARIAIIDDDLSAVRVSSCSLLDKSYIKELLAEFNPELTLIGYGLYHKGLWDLANITQRKWPERFLASRAAIRVKNHIKFNKDIFPREIVFERDYFKAKMIKEMDHGDDSLIFKEPSVLHAYIARQHCVG